MGAILSVLDSCGPSIISPADYMDREFERETRIKAKHQRNRMDIMGSAMDAAMVDVKRIIGMNLSDTEEKTE